MPVSFPGLGIEIYVDPVAFSIGNFSIRWYGLLIAIAFACGTIYAATNAKRYGAKPEHVIDVALIGTLCGFVGARIYYVLFAWHYFSDNILSVFDLSTGGLAIYGGIIGGIIGGIVVAKKRKTNIPACLDLFAFAMLISHSIGRWGNFTNQEAFGSTTNLPWGMVSANTGGVPVHPCFLYESLWCVVGFIIAHFVIKKIAKYRGQVFCFYMIWYGFGRAVIEGLRSDSLYLPFSIFGYTPRVSQVLSIALVIGAAIALFVFRKRKDLPIKQDPEPTIAEKHVAKAKKYANPPSHNTTSNIQNKTKNNTANKKSSNKKRKH